MSETNTHHHEAGVALIMVLGMVAIIAAWASTATYEDLVSIRRVTNVQNEMRATMASESAYAVVRYYLQQDAKDNATDSLDEDWALDLPPFPIDEGMVGSSIEDSNRYYNLNDLVDDAGTAQPLHVEQVQRLFISLDVDAALVDALVDWMDKNDSPYGASGAENSAYYNKDYKVKNSRLDTWSELKLILGFNRNILRQLKTVATVRPSNNNGATKVNMNTVQTNVLMALFPKMSYIDAETLIESRPYDDTNNLTNLSWAQDEDTTRLSVSSDMFMLRTHALFGRANVREEFLLSRNGQNIQTISRERLGWQF